MKNKSLECLQSLSLVIVLTAVAVTGLPLTGGPITTPAVDKDIVALHTNDVHYGVDDSIGYAGLILYKREAQRQTPYVTLVDTGDTIQGAPTGIPSDGDRPIDIMNYVGYDFTVSGSHEFDYDMSRSPELVGKLNCGCYSCNFIDNATGTPVLASYRMLTYEDTQVAFVGATTLESSTESTPACFQDSQGSYIYSSCRDENGRKLYNQVQASADAVRTEGTDYAILAGHLGENGIIRKWFSTNVIANTTGISACTDGHSYETVPSENVKNKSGQNVVLIQTGIELSHIGKLVISADGSIYTELIPEMPAVDPDGEYTVQERDTLSRTVKRGLGSYNRWADIYNSNLDKIKNVNMIPAGSTIVIPGGSYISGDGRAADYGTWQFIRSIENQHSETLETIPGVTPYEPATNGPTTGNHIVRDAETNLGDLTADAYRVELGANIGFSSGGGVCSVINPGNITYNDTLAIFPYRSTGCIVEATEQQIKDTLEMASKNCPEESGDFLQVSGLTYTIDTSARSGVQTGDKGNFTGVSGTYRVTDIKVAGESIDPDGTYTVTSHNYMPKRGGDGMTMFRGYNVIRDEVMAGVDILSSHIRRMGGLVTSEYINPAGQGGIIIRQNRK